MKKHANISMILFACFTLYLFSTGIENTAYAAQQNTKTTPQNDQQKIYGSVTDVITTDGFTYIEVATGKEKVWAAGPATPITKGDMVTFSAKIPMQNFHSKSLGRDFPLIYFVDRYLTGKETSASSSPHKQIKQQQTSKTMTAEISSTPVEIKAGGRLPDATLDGLNVKTKTFFDFKGKPLIINIWASWCGPCRAEMGSLERLAQRYNKKELNIIGISTDDYRNKATALIQQTGITFENFLDHNLFLESLLGANVIPLTILVDAEGRVLLKVRGPREWDSPEVLAAIGEVFHINLLH